MPQSPAPNFSWDMLPARYRVILCDIWGVVHDGVRLNPGAATRLRRWREAGRFVVLVTNAPRPADAIASHLDRMGLPRSCWSTIVTSGEAGIEALNALAKPVGFIGTADDRSVLEGRGVRIAEDDDFSDLACIGFREEQPGVGHYRPELARLAAQGVRLHCLNPDRVVMRGKVAEPCAGALADIYEELGGAVSWYGKPYPSIYDHALRVAGDPAAEQVLAVGDGLQTDMLGAARMGFDGVFVSGGIHAGEPFPREFASSHGLGDWQPIAVVDGLA
jgi:HAD superfamily hydrolase (TIGR01459 family)